MEVRGIRAFQDEQLFSKTIQTEDKKGKKIT